MKPEQLLSKFHEREYVLLTGNATVGLMLALKALGLKHKNIAVPNNVCVNVPIGVKLSGNSLIYLDVSKQDLGISLEEIKKNIHDIDAVIAVHAYGSVCDIENISKFCQNNRIPLIEDFAVAQGAALHNRPVGSFGDVSVVSFGAGKIIDIGHGGAVLTNDKKLYEEMVLIQKGFSEFSLKMEEHITELSRQHTQMYNRYYLEGQFNECLSFENDMNLFKNNFVCKFSPDYSDRLTAGLEDLSANIGRRRSNVKKFKQIFKHANGQLEVFEPSPESVDWRFNIFLSKDRNRVFRHLLKENYKISSWHPQASLFIKGKISGPQIVSDWIGSAVLNLWVNQEIDDAYINRISQEIIEALDAKRAS